jgi:hypothetical protein
MTRHEPLAVRASTAAAMLDLPPAEFMRLVGAGALPRRGQAMLRFRR